MRQTTDADVIGVCHRPGSAVPDTGCAKTLIGRSALKRHVEASGKEPRWVSNVRPVRFRGFDDSTQLSQGAVDLEWDLGVETISFVAHVVPGNSGLLLSRFDLKALGATIDLGNDQLHLDNPKVTLKLSTTPAGHYEIDLLHRAVEVATVDSCAGVSGKPVEALARSGESPKGF